MVFEEFIDPRDAKRRSGVLEPYPLSPVLKLVFVGAEETSAAPPFAGFQKVGICTAYHTLSSLTFI